MEPYETFEHKGLTVELWQDEDPENPYKAWDQAGEILSDVRDYDLGGGDVPHPESWHRETPSSAVMARYLTLFGGYVLAIPWKFQDYGSSGARVYLFDPDEDVADGWLVLSREAYDSEFGPEMPLTSDDPEAHSAERTIRGEFAAFAAWVEGDVSGYVVKDAAGEVIDSCWGYYGETDYVREEARSIAEHEASERARLRALPWLPTFGNPIPERTVTT